MTAAPPLPQAWVGCAAVTDAGSHDGLAWGAALAVTVDGQLLTHWWRKRLSGGAAAAEMYGARWLVAAGAGVVWTDSQAAAAVLNRTYWIRRTHPAIRVADSCARRVRRAAGGARPDLGGLVAAHPHTAGLLALLAEPLPRDGAGAGASTAGTV